MGTYTGGRVWEYWRYGEDIRVLSNPTHSQESILDKHTKGNIT